MVTQPGLSPVKLLLFAILCTLFNFSLSYAVNLNPDGLEAWGTKYSCEDKTHGVVKVTTEENACTGFIQKDGKENSSHISFGMRISGVLLASNDGRTVVAVQNHLYGKLGADGVFETDESDSEHNPFVVLIYRDGKQIGAYRLTEILHRPRMVGSSAACSIYHVHDSACPRVHWLLHYREFEQSGGKKLVLNTTSLRQVSLDLLSGKIIEEKDSPEWNQCEVIAHGPTAQLGSHGQMGPVYLAKGNLKEELSFVIPPGVNVLGAGSEQTLCLKNTPSGLVAISILPIHLYKFKNDLFNPPVSSSSLHSSKLVNVFQIDLLNTDYFHGKPKNMYTWKLSIKPDRPLQHMSASLSGTNEWRSVRFPNSNIAKSEEKYLLDINDVPEEATLLVDATDGHGHKIGPFTQTFDTRKMVRNLSLFWKNQLKSDPNNWVEIRDDPNRGLKFLYFNRLAEARCGLKENRYSIDNKSLDHQFSLTPCDVSSMETYLNGVYKESTSDSDLKRNQDINWPNDIKFVAIQLVFFDGSVSHVVVKRNKEKR